MGYRTKQLKVAGFYRRISEDPSQCTYCGERANTMDHLVPVCIASRLSSMGFFEGKVLVPACSECNSIAGGKLFRSIGHKRRYIQGKLKRKYRKFLDIPDWRRRELEQIKWTLKSCIEEGLSIQEKVVRRVKWRNAINATVRFG